MPQTTRTLPAEITTGEVLLMLAIGELTLSGAERETIVQILDSRDELSAFSEMTREEAIEAVAGAVEFMLEHRD